MILLMAAICMLLLQTRIHSQSITILSDVVGSAPHMTISFQGAPGNTNDWIGLFPYKANNASYQAWLYLGGQTNGNLVFNVPDTNGIYDFRMFTIDGTMLCRSSAFIVKKQ